MTTVTRGRPRIRTRLLYTALALAGGAAVVAGIAMVFPPLALVVAGAGVGLLGMIGLGMEARR